MDLVENRYVGMKSRGVTKPPAVLSCGRAQGVESLTMDREVMHLRDSLITRYSELVYYGYWFAPERLRPPEAHRRRPETGDRHGPAETL